MVIPIRTAKGIPAEAATRNQLRGVVARYVEKRQGVPPLTLETMTEMAGDVIAAEGMNADIIPFATVLVNNALWRNMFTTVPFERRVLM